VRSSASADLGCFGACGDMLELGTAAPFCEPASVVLDGIKGGGEGSVGAEDACDGRSMSSGVIEGTAAWRCTATMRFNVPPSAASMRARSSRSAQIAPLGCGIGPDLPVLGFVSALIRAGILDRSALRTHRTAEKHRRDSKEMRQSSRRGFSAHHLR
jgi:hypothetical protein